MGKGRISDNQMTEQLVYLSDNKRISIKPT